MAATGQLVCVGTGMTLGAQLTPLARAHIEQADVVFSLMSDALVELWIEEMHADVRSLQPYYSEGMSRLITYRNMVEAMMVEVRKGKKVCGAFYGHPGVFALVPHKAIATARAEGFAAHMEPGVSAEDCLYADLGIDPGKFGCIHYEASQYMFYKRQIDPSAYLILWQIGIAGDQSLARFSTSGEYREVLIEMLLEHYPIDHQIILYRAKTTALHTVRMDQLKLSDLAKAEVSLQDTLVIPPSKALERNQPLLDRLKLIDQRNQ